MHYLLREPLGGVTTEVVRIMQTYWRREDFLMASLKNVITGLHSERIVWNTR